MLQPERGIGDMQGDIDAFPSCATCNRRKADVSEWAVASSESHSSRVPSLEPRSVKLQPITGQLPGCCRAIAIGNWSTGRNRVEEAQRSARQILQSALCFCGSTSPKCLDGHVQRDSLRAKTGPTHLGSTVANRRTIWRVLPRFLNDISRFSGSRNVASHGETVNLCHGKYIAPAWSQSSALSTREPRFCGRWGASSSSASGSSAHHGR
jgi:hypothetical protein